MPANHTPNYSLNQWEPEDRVLRADFNADNAKIDAAIRGVAQKAEALSGSKADAAALEALAQRVTAQGTTLTEHAASMTKLGNCIVQTTSYSGNGGNCTLTFDHRVMAVFAFGGQTCFLAVRGAPYGIGWTGSTAPEFAPMTWGTNSVTWRPTANGHPLGNQGGVYYNAVALLNAAG